MMMNAATPVTSAATITPMTTYPSSPGSPRNVCGELPVDEKEIVKLVFDPFTVMLPDDGLEL